MADFSSFSDDSFNTGYQNVQAQQLNSLAIQQKQMVVQQQKQQQATQKAQQQQLQELLVRDQTKSALELSQDMIKAGLIDQGSKLMKVAAQAQEQISVADKNKAETEIKRQTNNLKSIEYIGGQLDNIHNQDDYDRFIRQIEPMIGTKLPDSIKNARWTPEYKARLQTLGMTWKDKAELQIKQHRLDLQEQNKDVERRLKEADLVEKQARTKEIQTRTEHLQKDQGKTPTIPKEDLQEASDLISSDFAEEGDSSTKANTAYTIASRASRMLSQNKGLDRATALQKVYNDMKKNGEISPKKDYKHIWSSEKTDTGKLDFKPKETEQKKNSSGDKESGTEKDQANKIQEARQAYIKDHPKANLTGAEAYLKEHPEYKDIFQKTFHYLPSDEGE